MCRVIMCVQFLLIMISSWSAAFAGQIDPILADKIRSSSPMEKFPVIIYLEDQVDLGAVEEIIRGAALPGEIVAMDYRYRTVIGSLHTVAEQTQPLVLDRLTVLERTGAVSDIRRFWIRNLLVGHATPGAIEEIAAWPEVQTVYLDGILERHLPVESGSAEVVPDGSEAGLRAINAHRMWQRGITGAGRIVMNIDTGVFGNHVAYNTRWRGTVPGVRPTWAWHDPSGGTTFPTDGDASSNHGTHTMGTMCGRDPSTRDTIGVAPDAMWIASNSLIGGNPHTSRSIAAFQWAANPDSNLATMDDVPDAISCSWYDPNSTATECSGAAGYWTVIDAVEALGTAVVFSAGNDGPNPSTVTSPKNRITTPVNIFAVGAIDGNNSSYPIASFSSRGPSTCPGPDSMRIKPEVSAPGVNVRSASGTTGYRTLSGTSMASPHVAGAIALLRQAVPHMTGTEIKYVLLNTAVDLGPAGEDNTYGKGIIDVWAAYQALADSADPNPPTNVKAYSDYTTPTSMLLTWTNPTAIVGGDSIGSFVIRILRDSVQIVEVPSPDTSYVDTGLTDGTLYRYTLQTRLLADDSLSQTAGVEWTAGGDRMPQGPTNLSVSGTSASGYTIRWTIPSRQVDGTPLDDLAGIRLYRDGGLVSTLVRTAGDTSRADSTMDMPSVGLHSYYVTVIDNETPINESAPSNTGFTPLEIPFFDNFMAPGTPNAAIWRTLNATVDDRGVNPPSSPYSMNLNGNPVVNGDTVETLALDLAGLQGAGLALSYFRQPRGLGDNPEAADSLIVEFRNSLGQWIVVRKFPGLATGDPLPPFIFDAVGVDGVNPGPGSTFFYNGFKLRFRVKAQVGAFDDWFVDDVFFGIPSGTANIGPSAVVTPVGQIANNAPVQPAIAVSNASAVQTGVYTVTVQINGPGTSYIGTQQDSNLAAGASRTVVVSPTFVPDVAGQWTVTAYTTLPEDPVASNDTIRSTIFVVNPLTLPVVDNFAAAGVPDPLVWTNRNAVVNSESVNPPSTPYALNLAGNATGVGLDTVTSLTINLAGLEGQAVTLAYYQQPQGTGDVPEAADSLITEALNNHGNWVVLKKLPGAALRAFQLERFNLDSMNAGGGTFFHSGFKFRFRSKATTATTTRQDDWFVDDVFFGIVTGTPQMAVSTAQLGDTLLVGQVDSTSYSFSIINVNPFGGALNFTIAETPVAGWVTVEPSSGSLPGSSSQVIRVKVDFTGVTPGMYATSLVVSGDDPDNAADTVNVNFVVNAAPAISVSPESAYFALAGGDSVTSTLVVRNAGPGTLTYAVLVEGGYAGHQTEQIGNAQNNLATSSALMRGGVVEVTTTVQLLEIRSWMNITTSRELRYAVYENTTGTSFTKVLEAVVPQSGTGLQWYSSGPVHATLEAGKRYAVGVGWAAQAGLTYYWQASAPLPLPVSFGTITGGLAQTVYPPPATITQSQTGSLYYTQLVTASGRWLTLGSGSSGTVVPGDSSFVEFNINTVMLGPGMATASLRIANNDPAIPMVLVPVEVDVVTGIQELTGFPEEYELYQNYPNPFNPKTSIKLALPEESRVTLKVYNIIGQEVVTLLDEQRPAGYVTVEWDGRNSSGYAVTSGVYFYRMEAAATNGAAITSIRKMILIK